MMSSRCLPTNITHALLCLLLVFTGCGDSHFLDKSRFDESILRGEAVTEGDRLASHVVMIVQDMDLSDPDYPVFFGICTGVLVDGRAVLTAAHCLDKGIKSAKVIMGAKPRQHLDKSSPTIFTPVSYRIHPDYKKLNETEITDATQLASSTDLAILYLDRTANFDDAKYSIGVDFWATAYEAIVAGYGKTSDLKDNSSQKLPNLNGALRQFDKVITSEQLQERYMTLEQWKAGGVCKGDSGAPVFLKKSITNELRLVSMAVDVYKYKVKDQELDPENLYSECAHTGLFINLAPYEKWINAMIAQLKSETVKSN